MEEDLNNLESIQSPKSTDRVSKKETIVSIDQNKYHSEAISSNPDQFPSVANLRIPNPDKIEPFQIIDNDGETLAASRKVEQAGSKTFHDGLKALGPEASEEDKARYQIEYMERKAGSNACTILIKTGIAENQEISWNEAVQAITQLPLNLQLSIIGNGLLSGANQFSNEQHERSAGSIIGTVQGVGSVAYNLAQIADFSAYCILGDARALEMGDKLGEAIGKTIVSGIRIYEAADKYLFDIGFNGDYSKPFSDVICVGIALDKQWCQLPPREQERFKSELIAQMVADGFVGYAGAQSIVNARTYLEVLDTIALRAAEQSGQRIGNLKKTIDTIKNQITSLLAPQLELAGGGKIKMRDFQHIKEDLALKMEGPPASKAFRGDDNFRSKVDEIGRPKTHLNEDGDLVPADLVGIFKGKPVDVLDHVCPYYANNAKTFSPFISLSLRENVAIRFGNERIIVNIEALRKAVSKGEVIGTDIIEHAELLELVKQSRKSKEQKTLAISTIIAEREMLVRGAIPARFLEIGK